MVAKLLDAVKGAGLKPEGVDLNAFALVRMIGEPDPIDPTEVAGRTAQVLCHFGGITNLAIASGSSCLFTRPLQTVWNGDDVAIGSLVEEIRLSVDFYMGQPESQPVDRIVLSGPGSRDQHLVSELSARSGLPVSVAEPLGTHPIDTVPPMDDPFRYTVAAGLALGDPA
jgi:Tfp pilus assembly PilM family ATPase